MVARCWDKPGSSDASNATVPANRSFAFTPTPSNFFLSPRQARRAQRVAETGHRTRRIANVRLEFYGGGFESTAIDASIDFVAVRYCSADGTDTRDVSRDLRFTPLSRLWTF